jgi:hypothetical protein
MNIEEILNNLSLRIQKIELAINLASEYNEYEESLEHENLIQSALMSGSERTDIWEDREHYICSSEEEKTIYLRGVKKGYFDALFWIAYYFDEVEFFDKLRK